MRQAERVTDLARRAAELLPEPPPADDTWGYREWEALVLDTAARLAGVAGVRACVPAALGPRARQPVTWQELLVLASVVRRPDGHHEADDLLRRIEGWWAPRPGS